MSNKEITRVPEILPDNLAAESVEFVTFLKKYYEWMGQEGNPSYDIDRSLTQRTLDNAVDFYLSSLYNELGYGFVLNNEANQQNIINNLAEIYSAKGSLQSIKVMFRALFGEEIEIKLPKEQILKASSGNWLSEYSVIVELNEGDIYSTVGKYVEVETTFPNTPTQTFDVEVKRVEQREETSEAQVFEVYVSRYFAGFFYFDSVIKYGDVRATLQPSMSEILNVEKGGTGFRVGESFPINDYIRASGFNTQAKLPTQFRRRVYSRSGLRRVDIEDVDTDVRSDGTITQTIKLGDIVTTRIIRGTNSITRIERGGQIREFKETLQGIPTPNLAINWDAISSAMTELAGFDGLDGTVSIFLYDFLKDTPTATYVDGSTDPLFDTNPGATQYARGDFDRDGTLSIDDATSVIKYLFDIDPSLHAGDADRYDRITDVIAAWNAYTTANGLAEYAFDLRVPNTSGDAWDPMYSIPIDVGVDLLRLSVDAGALSLSEQTTQLNELAGTTGYKKGDIDNDGVIDTDDLIALLKYQDPLLRVNLTADEIAWITQFLDTGSVSDLDLMVSAMALDFQSNRRNQLHDFLLQVDGDYATGRVRGDINQNGRITLDDVTLLLRRASGYYDLSKGAIQKIDVNTLVGGYKEGTGTVSLTNFGDGTGAQLSTILRDGVITDFNTISAGKGLRNALALIQVLPESKIENVPDDWRFITFAQGISYYEIELNIVNGKIQNLSTPGLMYNFPPDPFEAVIPTWEEASLTPIINSSNEITGFNIIDGGTGYDPSSAYIEVVDVEGSGISFNPNPVGVKDGVIDKIKITDGGQNYNPATTTVTVTTSSGTSANLTPVITGGVLTGVTIVDGGEDYDPTVDTIAVSDTGSGTGANIGEFEVIDGIIDSIGTPSDGGANYSANARAYVRRGNSTAATPQLQAIVQDGVIAQVVVDRQGINYPSTTTLSNTFQRHEPTLKATLNSSGGITGIVAFDSLDNEASKSLCGWQSATITVTDLAAEAETSPGAGDAIGGTGASITVDIDDGKISGFLVGASGSGYIEPQVTITGTRLNSTFNLVNTPDYVEWIDEVIGEPLLGSTYNPLLVDGPGVGANARVTKVGSNGELEEIKLTSFGFNYPEIFTTIIAPENPAGTNAQVTFRSGVVGVTSPNYVDRKGFLSDIIKIQDNDLYQEFSYVVQTGVDFDIFEDLIKKSVHPAGMKIFGEQSINSFFSLSVQQFEVSSFFFNRIFRDRTDNGELDGGGDGTSTSNEDTDTYHFEKDLPRDANLLEFHVDAAHEKETYSFIKPLEEETDSPDDDDYHLDKDLGAPQYIQYADAGHLKETYHMDKDMEVGSGHEQVADAGHLKETYHIDKDLTQLEKYIQVATGTEAHTYSYLKDLPRYANLMEFHVDAANNKEVYSFVKDLPRGANPLEFHVDVSEEDTDTYHMDKDMEAGSGHEQIADAGHLKETYHIDKDLTQLEKYIQVATATESDVYSFEKDLPTYANPIEFHVDVSEEDSDTYSFVKDLPRGANPLEFHVDVSEEDIDTYHFEKDLPRRADLLEFHVDAAHEKETYAFVKLLEDEADSAEVPDDTIYSMIKKLEDLIDPSEDHEYHMDKDMGVDSGHEQIAYALSVSNNISFDKDLPRDNDPTSDHTDFSEEDIDTYHFEKDFPTKADLLEFHVDATEQHAVSFTKTTFGIGDDAGNQKATVTESESVNLGKALADSAGVDDIFSTQDEDIYLMAKSIGETVGITDDFGANDFSFTRLLTEFTQGIDDGDISFSLSTGLSDQTDDLKNKDDADVRLSKALADSTNPHTDSTAVSLSKAIAANDDDTASILDELALAANFSKSLQSTNPDGASDAETIAFIKELEDQTNFGVVDPITVYGQFAFKSGTVERLYWREDDPFPYPDSDDVADADEVAFNRPTLIDRDGAFYGYSATTTNGGSELSASNINVFVGDIIEFKYERPLRNSSYPANGFWIKTSKTFDQSTDNVTTGITNHGMPTQSNNLTAPQTMTWDTSDAAPGTYYIVSGESHNSDFVAFKIIVSQAPSKIDHIVNVSLNKRLEDSTGLRNSDVLTLNAGPALSDEADAIDISSLEDSDIYSINKSIQDFTVDVTDSGSNVITRPYVALGYIAETNVNTFLGLVGGLDYEYSSETSEVTF